MQSISEMTNSALRGDVLERLSGQIRENPSAIKRGLEQAIPASMAGLSSYASSEQNAEVLLGGLRGGMYPQVEADDVPEMVSDPAATARLTQSSSSLIGQIFGGRQVAVVDAIAKQSGLTRSGATTVLGLATPLVLSAVSKETEHRHLDARGLSRMLGDEGRSASGSLPGSIAGALGLGAIGAGAIGMARGTTSGVSEEGRGVGERVREEGRSFGERAREDERGLGERAREEERGLGARARGAAHEARGAAAGARESIAEKLHRTRHTTATTGAATPETGQRKGFGWKLAAIAVAALAALFLFSRRNATPEMPKVSTPETPQATAPKVTAPQEQPAQPQAAQPQQGAQPQAEQPQAAPPPAEQPQAAPPQAAQPQAEQQQGAQPPEGAQQPSEQPSAQQAAPEAATEEPAASPTEPAAEQPAGVAAEPLAEGTGAAPLSALLDGDATLPKRFELQTVKFETGATEVASNDVLDEVADVLQEHPEATVRLDGYTDASGDAAANEALSAERADAVKDYLVEQGVAEDAIETSGMGTERPVASNDTQQGMAENRRVELVVTAR